MKYTFYHPGVETPGYRNVAPLGLPEEYIYSSATNYAEMESVLDVIRMDLKWKTYF
jgi:hypothetical protein